MQRYFAMAGVAFTNRGHRPFILLVSATRIEDQTSFLIPAGTGTFNHITLSFLDSRRLGLALTQAFTDCERYVLLQTIDLDDDDLRRLTQSGFGPQI